MAVTGTHMRVIIRYTYLGQRCENIQYYRLTGAAFLTATVLGVLEAYWNNIKTVIRAMGSTSTVVNTFDSLLGYEIGGSLGYAEYSIPPGERAGTRAAGDDGEWLASFVAGGFRQTVATRTTRPGQKRFPFVREGDVEGQLLLSSYTTLLGNVVPKFVNQIALGAPVATGVMEPAIARSVPTGDPTVFQDVEGFVLNTNVTSQVSRKIGRGI